MSAARRSQPHGHDLEDVARSAAQVGLERESRLPTGRFEDWRSEIQTRLRHKAVQALAALIDGAEGRDGLAQRQAYAQQLIEIDPTEELGYRVLMETYEAQSERSLRFKPISAAARCCARNWASSPMSRRGACGGAGACRAGGNRARSGEARMSSKPAAAELQTEQASKFPAVVLLPPSTVIDDATIGRVATALVEDVIAGLSRCRSFTVIAAHTSSQDRQGAGRAGRRGAMCAMRSIPASSRCRRVWRRRSD